MLKKNKHKNTRNRQTIRLYFIDLDLFIYFFGIRLQWDTNHMF